MNDLTEIAELEKYIDDYEKKNLTKYNITSVLVQFRHRVLFVHSDIERVLEKLISRYFMFPLVDKGVDKEPFAKVQFGEMWILGWLSFQTKSTMAKKLGLLSNGAHKKLRDVNSVRNSFGHPNWKNIHKYTKVAFKLKVLKLLKEAMDEMEKVEKIKITPELYNENFEEIILAKEE
ncbi:MAG: hypothetical protein UU21_C0016G0009 [Candidatus Levybacteria bacterium GW2011_GWA2_40_8]|nr:MAG: hypothetical protein UU21_C0016G0009 [Candidatus Levybacteria bacterium GW2011_GWA2_40_8]